MTLENLVHLPKVYNNITNLYYFTQKNDGTIGLKFQYYRRSCSRASTSYRGIINKYVSHPRYSLSQWETNLQGINKGKTIDTLFYSLASATSVNEINNHLNSHTELNDPLSPTQSQMNMNYNKEDSQIYMITQEYEINKEKLHKDFMSPKYDDKRKWFLKHFQN